MFRLPPVYSRFSLERSRSKRSVGSSDATTAGWFLPGPRFFEKTRFEAVLRGVVTVEAVLLAALGLAAEEGAELLIQCQTEMMAITSSTSMMIKFLRFSAPIFTGASLPSLTAFSIVNHRLVRGWAPM